jgi:hypothetical protein
MDALQEFEEPEFKFVPTGAIKKNITGILDAVLVFIIADLLGTFVIPYRFFATNYSAGKMGFYYLSVFIVYRIIAIIFLSSTVGMRLLRSRYMQEDSLQLTLKEKVLAALMVYINGIRMYNLK